MIRPLNARMPRSLSPFVFSLVAACAHSAPRTHHAPQATLVPRVTRVTAPAVVAATQRAEAWPEPAPRDPLEQSFEQSVLIRLAEISRALRTTLSMQAHTTLIRSPSERDLYVSDVRVRHDPSGRERTVRVFATRPAVLALGWRLRDWGGDALLRAGSALMFERWLQERPSLRSFATFHTSGEAWLRWQQSDHGAVVCAHETPAHGPVFEGCWTERAALAPLSEGALQYRYGGREQLQIRYVRQGGSAVSVRIDHAGVHGARAVESPDWGPLAHLHVTVLSYTAPERVQVTDDLETFECVREGQWRCEGYRSAR